MLRILAAAFLVTFVMTGPSRADDAVASAASDQINSLVGDLSSPDPEVRRTASQKLTEMGSKEVVDALVETAKTPNAEAGLSSVMILSTICGKSENEEVKKAAEAGLKEVSEQEGPIGRIAARRLDALKPAAGGPLGPGGILPRGGAMGVRVRVSVTNGARSIDIEEGNRTVRFRDENGKDIRVEVETKVDGKLKVERHEVADEAELKKKHPELAALFEKYGKAVQMRAQGNIPFIPPNFPPNFPQQNPAQTKQANTSIEAALDKLRELKEQIEGDEKLTDEQRKAFEEQLDTVRKELHAAQAALE
ncbi:MAG: HEAT repeat domain-containing protein [Planctomycetaceae bacterium]|nr:HEAT repeat domain-containing protein [Planctomycetaceae bacterium]MCB9949817.1 HEAT repeat domain-containing protein [Planctomycetaceae bacterium]